LAKAVVRRRAVIKSEIYIFLAPSGCCNDLVALGDLRLIPLVFLVRVVVLGPCCVLIEKIE
jgi:hypothetical protein